MLRGKVAVLVELYLKRRELRELNRSLAQANEQLAQANVTLQAEKTRELEALNATLQRANDELERANRSLQNEVAERARAELALQEADRNKDEFLAMLAHELRNPLAPMLNAVQLMRMQPTEPQMSWARDVIRAPAGCISRASSMICSTCRASRAARSRWRASRWTCGRSSSAPSRMSSRSSRRAGTGSLSNCRKTPLRLDGDPTRLTQALANVLGNAAKYTDGAGHIDLRCEEQEGCVLIRVRDDGIGIPADLLPRIFELFTQLDRRVGSSSGGLGIGLALVRRLVEMHGGSVSAHSDGAGRGSEFVMTLPLLGADAAAARAEAAGTDSAPQPVSRRILVADDNADALESLAVLLKMSGHRGIQRSQRCRGARGGRGAPARSGAARHRHAAARWL